MAGLFTLFRKTGMQCRSLARSVRYQSRLKTTFIAAFAGGLFVGLWFLFLHGFTFLDSFQGASSIIFGRLYSLFFLGMGSMILVSSMVTAYSTIYRSDEIAFLVVRPFRTEDIVLYKFFETVILSSWAFFLIIVPFVGSYSWHEHMSPSFLVWPLLFAAPFIILCAGSGTLITLICVRWVPFERLLRIFGVLAIAALFGAAFYVINAPRQSEDNGTFLLSRLIPGLQFAAHPLAPSRWLAEGVLSLSRGEWFRGGMVGLGILSNALLAGLLVRLVGSATFYEAWQRVIAAGGSARRRTWLYRGLDRLLFFTPSDLRAMASKDIRIFLRDPMQWSQVLVFFGLLALYFANLRSFNYHLLEDRWRNTIAFLNVFSVSAVMCSLSSRFVYPQLSLEGQQFWILGLSPITMGKVLLSKFILSLLSLLAVGGGLVFTSAHMLALPAASRGASLGIIIAVSFAVAGISTGMGAIFLDLRQRNPSAIVSGFGGTLNLLCCLSFMLIAILPFGGVFHLYFTQRITAQSFERFLHLGAAWLVLITVLATVTPLWLGRRSLMRREY